MTAQIKENSEEVKPEVRKAYTKPGIIHELELETRAGSPLGLPFPNPLNLP